MGFTRYIGTLQLKYLIMFRMGQLHMKLSANRNAAAGDLELLNSKLQSNITISQTMKNEIYVRLPQVLRRILKEGNHIFVCCKKLAFNSSSSILEPSLIIN